MSKKEILFCDDCIHLEPDEIRQIKDKEPHMCKAGHGRIMHYELHPRLPRPINCISYKVKQ